MWAWSTLSANTYWSYAFFQYSWQHLNAASLWICLTSVSLPRFLSGGLGVPGTLSSWTWTVPPLSWFRFTKRGMSVSRRTAWKLSVWSSEAGDSASSCVGLLRRSQWHNMLAWHRNENMSSELDPQHFLNVLNYTFKTHRSVCTTVVCCRFLVFPSSLSNFLDWKLPSGQIYTQRQGKRGPPVFRLLRCFRDRRPRDGFYLLVQLQNWRWWLLQRLNPWCFLH